jgi:hypothetical protein
VVASGLAACTPATDAARTAKESHGASASLRMTGIEESNMFAPRVVDHSPIAVW